MEQIMDVKRDKKENKRLVM